MTNRKAIENKLEDLGYKLGCYNEVVETLTKPQLKKVLDNLQWETFHFNAKSNTIYIETVDNEKDIMVLSKTEYKERFGYWNE